MVTVTPWPQWPFDIACYTLLAIGVPLLIWAWWWDRPRGRHRCPKCWYNLAGLEIPKDRTQPPCTCPECGREVRSVRQTTRTHRRRWWAGLAVVMVLIAPLVWRIPDSRERGWAALLPTTAIGLYEQSFGVEWYASEVDRRVFDEATERMNSRGTWAWQRRWLLNLRARLLIEIRDPSPEGYPVFVWAPGRPMLEPVAPTTEPEYPPRPSHERVWRNYMHRQPALPRGKHKVQVTVRLEGLVHTISVPFSVRGTLVECMHPTNSPKLDRDVAEWLTPRLIQYPTSNSIVIDLRASKANHSGARTSSLSATLALRITALRDGLPMARGEWMDWQRASDGRSTPDDPALLEGTDEALAALRAAINSNDPAERARWTFTFTGDGELALSDVYSDAYWAGSFTMTLDELLAPPPSNTSAPAPSENNPNK